MPKYAFQSLLSHNAIRKEHGLPTTKGRAMPKTITAAITLPSLIQTGATVNTVAHRTLPVALRREQLVNAHVHLSAMNLKQQTDLLDDEIQTLHYLVRANSDHHSSLYQTSSMSLYRRPLRDSQLEPWHKSLLDWCSNLQMTSYNLTRHELSHWVCLPRSLAKCAIT